MGGTEKKSFLLYFDTYPSIADLPAEQRGELFSALFEYALAEAESPEPIGQSAVLDRHPEMSVAARMAFSFMAKTIQRDTEKWRQKHVRYQQAAQQRLLDAAQRQRDLGGISRRAAELAAPKDYSGIGKYARDLSTAGRLPKSDDSGTLDPR